MFHRKALFAALPLAALVTTPAEAANVTAQASVNVVKPLQLSKTRDLNFGTVTFNSGSTGVATISISQAGVLTCSSNAICTGAVASAGFNVQGSNKMTAGLVVPSANLSNGTDTIAFTPDAPSGIYLPNSGAPGIDFGIGGSISIGAANGGGTYTGTISVTAEYQ